MNVCARVRTSTTRTRERDVALLPLFDDIGALLSAALFDSPPSGLQTLCPSWSEWRARVAAIRTAAFQFQVEEDRQATATEWFELSARMVLVPPILCHPSGLPARNRPRGHTNPDFTRTGAGDGTRTRGALCGRRGLSVSPLVCSKVSSIRHFSCDATVRRDRSRPHGRDGSLPRLPELSRSEKVFLPAGYPPAREQGLCRCVSPPVTGSRPPLAIPGPILSNTVWSIRSALLFLG
jgi:hypothetical protein